MLQHIANAMTGLAHYVRLAGVNIIGLLIYANFQERVFRIPGFVYVGWMSMIFFFVLAFCGFVELAIRGELKLRRGKLSEYVLLGCVDYGSVFSSNAATNYISYPLRVVSKSFSVFITMIISKVWVGKQYTTRQYVSVAVLTFGILFFWAGDYDVSLNPMDFLERTFIDLEWERNNFGGGWIGPSIWGFGFIILAILLESFMWNLSEKNFFCADVNASPTEVTTWSAVFGFLVSVVCEIVHGGFTAALKHSEEHPEVVYYCVISSFCAYIAYNAGFEMAKCHGSVLAEVANNIRKVGTIVLSFYCFGHKVTYLHVIGMMLYTVALVMTVLGLVQRNADEKAKPLLVEVCG